MLQCCEVHRLLPTRSERKIKRKEKPQKTAVHTSRYRVGVTGISATPAEGVALMEVCVGVGVALMEVCVGVCVWVWVCVCVWVCVWVSKESVSVSRKRARALQF